MIAVEKLYYAEVRVLVEGAKAVRVLGPILYRLHGYLRANPEARVGWTLPDFKEGTPNQEESSLRHVHRARVGSVLRLFATSREALAEAAERIRLVEDVSRSRIVLSPIQAAPASTQGVAMARIRYKLFKNRIPKSNRTAAEDLELARVIAQYRDDAHRSAFVDWDHGSTAYMLEFKEVLSERCSETLEDLSSYGTSTITKPVFLPRF